MSNAKLGPRPAPYIWPTWIVGLLAGDDHCAWAPWFKAHNKYAKHPRSGDLAKWKANHTDMVTKRAAQLRADGYTVFVEDENKFTLQGKTGIEVGGCPDIVAIKYEPVTHECDATNIAVAADGRNSCAHCGWNDPRTVIDALVVDCKSGKQRDKDWWQVVVYMMIVPLTHAHGKGLMFRGELQYTERTIKIGAEEGQESFDRVSKQIKESGGPDAPRRSPSRRECRFCDITKADCPQRIDEEVDAETTNTELF